MATTVGQREPAAEARRFRKATIKDVAAHADVSVSAVSHFLRGRTDICSAQTGERIRAAVTALNYAPARSTRGMSGRATRNVGLLMSGPADRGLKPYTSFFLRLWEGIAAAADEEEYQLLHFCRAVRDSDDASPFLNGQIDGLLIHTHYQDLRPAATATAGLPTVLLVRARNIPEGCGAVWVDEDAVAGLALSHLWERGHRRIAHLIGAAGGSAAEDGGFAPGHVLSDTAIARREAYAAWMGARDAFRPGLVASALSWGGPQARPAVAEAVHRWHALPERPTAVFAANDWLAAEVIRAAAEIGWSVPGGLSVVGVDDDPDVASPVPLTTVRVPVDEVGRQSFRALLALMAGADIGADAERVRIPVTEIVVRGSTVAAAAPLRTG